MPKHNIIPIQSYENHSPNLKMENLMTEDESGNWRMDHPQITLAADSAITLGAVVLPIWVYTLSAWAGFFTVMLGLIIVIIRLVVAVRDLKRGRIINDEDVNVG